MDKTLNFSSCQRSEIIEQIQNKEFDILICGGGITGAGIALDAASRGLSVLLVEKNDFASGASSRSTKLMPGGLDYLKKLSLKSIVSLYKERKILHQNITHNVIPTPVILPIIKGGMFKKSFLFLFILYDYLSGIKKEHHAKWIDKTTLLKSYPYLNSTNLHGAYLYYEYKINDARLVIETLKKAKEYKAVAINHMQVIDLLSNNKNIIGAKIKDAFSDITYEVKAKKVINATGSWSEQFTLNFDNPIKNVLYLKKGVHIVVNKERFPLKQAFYFDTYDKSMVFAIPKQEHVYIGTTNTPFKGNLSHYKADSNDLDYLLKVVNHKFTDIILTRADIVSYWTGIRPLIQDKKGNIKKVSIHKQLVVSSTGLITITSENLSSFRIMAKQVVDLIMKDSDKPFIKCFTQNIQASGSNWETPPPIEKLVEIADAKYDEAKQTGITVADFKLLFYRYGTNIDILTEKAYTDRSKEKDPQLLWLKVEIWYTVNFEMVSSLSDFFIYRTEMVLFYPEKVNKYKTIVATELAQYLCWSDEEKMLQIEKFENHCNDYLVE